MKVIYESKTPEFYIGCDEFQWILSEKSVLRSNGNTDYKNQSFYPTLSNLLESLSEKLFRRMATKVNELTELDKTIDKVYEVIRKTIGEREFKGVFGQCEAVVEVDKGKKG